MVEDIKVPVQEKQAEISSGQSSTLVIHKHITVFWESPDQNSSEDYRIMGQPKPALPVKYEQNGTVNLVVRLENFSKDEIALMSLTLGLKDMLSKEIFSETIGSAPNTSQNSIVSQVNDFDEHNEKRLECNLDSILRGLNNDVNRNVIEASVRINCNGKVFNPQSTNFLHIIRQKLILFIPGVCGSTITVRSHPDEDAYPEWGLLEIDVPLIYDDEIELLWLECDKEGDPTLDSEAIKVDLLRSFVQPIYNVEEQEVVNYPPNHPRLVQVVDESVYRIPYYKVIPWPYDWRLRLEYAVDALMGISPKGNYTGSGEAVRPSIEEIIKKAQENELEKIYDKNKDKNEKFTFLDEKVALVCHSTGGLITQGVLKRDGVKKLVDKAFFINVPFRGAPKAYYVYLTGDMLPMIRNWVMRKIAPNTSIVYYLAPTELYHGEVMIIHKKGKKTIKRFYDQNVGELMNQLVEEAREKGDYPDIGEIPVWNTILEKDAKKFHHSILGEPEIGWDNCTAFYSNGHETPGPVFVNPGHELGTNIDKETVDGDGTVPTISQKADFPLKCLELIPSCPEHVPAPNDEFVWYTIIDKLCRVVSGLVLMEQGKSDEYGPR